MHSYGLDCQMFIIRLKSLGMIPKSNGGLGIRKLRETSKVFAMGFVWKVFSLSGSPWVFGLEWS